MIIQNELDRAVDFYIRGRLSAAEYRRLGWMAQDEHRVDVPLLNLPCCQEITSWVGSSLPTHFSSAKHVANFFSVDRNDLLNDVLERFVRQRGLRPIPLNRTA